MSVEAAMRPHFVACIESADPVCVLAFADRLMESWPDAAREDAEHFFENGGVEMPVLRWEYAGRSLTIDHDDSGQVKVRLRRPFRPDQPDERVYRIQPLVINNRPESLHISSWPPPPEWDQTQLAQFVKLMYWLRS